MIPSLVRAGKALGVAEFDTIRRQLCLEHAKWDPQVGDVATLARFALILSEATWTQLSNWAEALAAELLAAENELIALPSFQRRIGVPWRLRQVMQPASDLPRIVRFDFHPTTIGWQISEANADVPGGFNEGSVLSKLMLAHVPGTRVAGDPLQKWADTVAAICDETSGVIALAAAPGFMEDAQVVAGLAKVLKVRNLDAAMCAPRNLVWHGHHRARLWDQPVSVIVRFVQAEWLPALTPHWKNWWRTPVPILNPPTAAIVESKRLPLVWEKLKTAMPTWQRLLPATADRREAPWRTDEWIVKPTYGNTGDDVACIAWTPEKEWRRIERRIRFAPRSWVAQRRFDVVPVETPMGGCHPCIGVFTIGGRVAGAYGRIATGPVVDYRAVDAAVLIETDNAGQTEIS